MKNHNFQQVQQGFNNNFMERNIKEFLSVW
jgi:hypothetical protein